MEKKKGSWLSREKLKASGHLNQYFKAQHTWQCHKTTLCLPHQTHAAATPQKNHRWQEDTEKSFIVVNRPAWTCCLSAPRHNFNVLTVLSRSWGALQLKTTEELSRWAGGFWSHSRVAARRAVQKSESGVVAGSSFAMSKITSTNNVFAAAHLLHLIQYFLPVCVLILEILFIILTVQLSVPCKNEKKSCMHWWQEIFGLNCSFCIKMKLHYWRVVGIGAPFLA